MYEKIVGSPKREANILEFISFLHTGMFSACCFRQSTYMAQGFVNEVLNETWTHLFLQFEWFSIGYGFI